MTTKNIFIFSLFILLIFNNNYSQETLNINQAIEKALKKNFSISVAKNILEINENNSSIGNAGFLPELNATAGYNRSEVNTRQEYSSGQIVDRTGAISTTNSAGISLSWTLFDGMKMFLALDGLNVYKTLGELQFKRTVENTVASVIKNYNEIIRLQKEIESIQNSISISEERLSIEKDKQLLGTASKFDVLQAQVDLNEDRSQLLRQELLLIDAKISLNRLMSESPNYEFNIEVNNELTIQTTPFETYLEQAAGNNKKLHEAAANVSLSELNLSLQKSERYPKLSFNAGYNFSRVENQAGLVLFNKSNGLNFGLTASINIFDGLNTKRKIENAYLELQNSRISYEEIENEIEGELLKVYRRYENVVKILKHEEENLSVAKERVEIAVERLRLGAISSFEFREAQKNLVDAESRFENAKFQLNSTYADILLLTGGFDSYMK